MKDYANFMAEIQEYLKEPVMSNEEQDFKDDIQVSISSTCLRAAFSRKRQKKLFIFENEFYHAFFV